MKLADIQRCQLLVGDLEEVAILAKRGELQTASFKLFHPIQFMLATPQETAVDAVASMQGKIVFAEDKLDGIRADSQERRSHRDLHAHDGSRRMNRFRMCCSSFAICRANFCSMGKSFRGKMAR